MAEDLPEQINLLLNAVFLRTAALKFDIIVVLPVISTNFTKILVQHGEISMNIVQHECAQHWPSCKSLKPL